MGYPQIVLSCKLMHNPFTIHYDCLACFDFAKRLLRSTDGRGRLSPHKTLNLLLKADSTVIILQTR